MSLEIRALDLGASGIAEAVVELQRASYRVEADLLGARTLPVLKESPRRLRRTREQFLGAYEAERLVGAVSWKRTGALVDIHRLVVHPDRFRRGIAGALLDALAARPARRGALDGGDRRGQRARPPAVRGPRLRRPSASRSSTARSRS